MRIRYASFSAYIFTFVTNTAQVYAWGAVGHEMTATIAQMYLHPSVLPQICAIVYPYTPPKEPCHLAPIATWADRVRGLPQYRWASGFHYVGGIHDWPPSTCMFGQDGWEGRDGVNVLAGIANTTRILRDYTASGVNQDGFERVSESLKYVIHFLGDLHQPLHLTARERGGNEIKVHFHRRMTNFHSVWDSRLISNGILSTPSNYSRPLPYPADGIEDSLRGTIYDPYIRSIVWEGLMQEWKDDLEEWISCPSALSNQHVDQLRFGQESDPARWDNDFVCPYHWAKPTAALNCKVIFPPELDWAPGSNETHQAYELDTPKYAGKIRKLRILEKLLAQGGIRTAAVLNGLFAPEEARRSGLPLYINNISL
ncbi:SubName: Full=Related to nuclease Le3 {ECO:0000313/EMBL:CCA77833.1} [Serendipita indica DSM 11827]|uniref:Related to nuclease Le3 n=1 Tax=Serendipita indica (strain DSM 11827) TaxID=1109443 RepID=G4U2S2_SERID|nr:SubName: Full=Related to nuclease Le3 {ECO:0000313/EMBL:CCA77833.1} [Serendipita indica DSM 11827]CCA77833.1 related to nuclease Le3 [Serendipita indica DSM 11827]